MTRLAAIALVALCCFYSTRHGAAEDKFRIASAARWLKLDLATTRAAFDNYLPCYSADGALPDQALWDLIQYELARSNLKKEIPLTRVASRALLAQAQKELNLR